METPKYIITLEVSKLEDIIINSINKVYGSHIGYITKNLKEALIENAVVVKTMYSIVRDNEAHLFKSETSNHEIFEIKDNEAFLGYTNSNGNFDFVQIPINLKADNNDNK